MSTGRRAVAGIVVLAIVGWSTSASGDPDPAPPPTPTPASVAMPTPHLRLTTGDGVLVAPSGAHITIPRGSHVLDGPTWDRLDAETRRLQDAETRLTATNKVLRSSVETWQPGWKTLLGAVVVGAGLGWYVHSKF